MFNVRPLEVFLVQIIIYVILWLSDSYMATLISVVMIGIGLAILIIASIAELIERSKVPRSYFWLMAGMIFAPVIVSLGALALGFQPFT